MLMSPLVARSRWILVVAPALLTALLLVPLTTSAHPSPTRTAPSVVQSPSDAAARPSPSADTSTYPAPSSSVLDDPFVREEGKRGLDLLYDMQFDAARAIFREIDARYPDHPVGPFLRGLNVWWKIMLNLDATDHDDAFYAAMDETIARAEAMLDDDEDNFDAMFFKGAALGFRGRLRSNRSEWMKAAYDGKRAIGYVRSVAQRAPENHDYVFGKGMYDYYAAILPEEYPISKAVTWMMPDGDRERGLSLLKRTAEKGWYIQTEAVYFLAQIHYLYENNYATSLHYVKWLREHHPNNPYFHVFEGRIYARWGRWEQVRRVFGEVADRCDAEKRGYNAHMGVIAHYYLARQRLYADAYDEALHHLARLETYTNRSTGDANYKTLGYLYQGKAYDALGRRDMAVNRYRLVLRRDDAADAHETAREHLEAPYPG